MLPERRLKIMANTQVLNIPRASRNTGLITFDVPQPIPDGLLYGRMEITLDLVDKLAVGKSLDISFFLSPDGVQPYVRCNYKPWTSYGPDGISILDPGETVPRVNPNPIIDVPLTDYPGNPRVGYFLRSQVNFAQAMFAGAVISIFS